MQVVFCHSILSKHFFFTSRLYILKSKFSEKSHMLEHIYDMINPYPCSRHFPRPFMSALNKSNFIWALDFTDFLSETYYTNNVMVYTSNKNTTYCCKVKYWVCWRKISAASHSLMRIYNYICIFQTNNKAKFKYLLSINTPFCRKFFVGSQEGKNFVQPCLGGQEMFLG